MFEVTYSPSRAAYLIRPNSKAGMRRAVAEATTRWGGLTEPIIVVPPSARLSRLWGHVLDVANVDGLVNVDVEHDAAQKIADDFSKQLVPIDDIDRWGETMFSSYPSLIGPEPEPPLRAAAESADLWAVTAAGALTADQAAFVTQQGRQVAVLGDDMLGRAQLQRATLLHATLPTLQEHQVRPVPSALPAVIWVCRPNSFRDCLEFWNWRALAPLRWAQIPMLLLPAGQVQHWLGFTDQLHATLARPSEFRPDVVLKSYDQSDAALRSEAQHLALTVTAGTPIETWRRWPVELRQPPYTCALNADLLPYLSYDRTYGTEPLTVDTHVDQGRATLRVATPMPVRPGGYWRMRIRSDAFAGIPRRDSTANFIWANTIWEQDGLRALTNVAASAHITLQIPDAAEVVTSLLDLRTSSHALSDKGRLASPLIDDGSFQVLLRPGLYPVMTALATPREGALLGQLRQLKGSGAAEAELKELAATWGGRTERRYRQAGELGLRGQQAVDAAEALCAAGWAQRGLEIRCGRCSVRSFVPFTDDRPQPTCPGCGFVSPYQRQRQLSVQYRLTSYLDRVATQGLLPGLWTAAHLVRSGSDVWLHPGVDLWFPDLTDKRETDVFGIASGMVLCGEVKSSTVRFTRDQIDRDIDIATRLQADELLLACPEPLRPATVAYAERGCRRAGLNLRVVQPA